MDEALRRGLWNAIFVVFFDDQRAFVDDTSDVWREWVRSLYQDFLEERVDEIPSRVERVANQLREYVENYEWDEVYDLLEFLVQSYNARWAGDLAQDFNLVLDRYMAGYRIVDEVVVSIVNEVEIQAIEDATEDETSSSEHLRRALELFSDRDNPDFENAIKEAISAVEAEARRIAENPNATLSDALKALKKQGRIHAALEMGIQKLYAYAGDESGVRHAAKDGAAPVTGSEAHLVITLCAGIAMYLRRETPEPR